MSLRKCLTIVSFFALCLFGPLFFAPAQDQPAAEKVIVLNEAQTLADVNAYIQQELSAGGIDDALDAKARETLLGKVLMPAGEKILEISQTSGEIMDAMQGYGMIFRSLSYQITAEVEGAEEKMEAFFKKLESDSRAEVQMIAEQFRGIRLVNKIFAAEPSPENFNTFKSELNNILNGVSLQYAHSIIRTILEKVQDHDAPIESFADDMIAFFQSPECTLSEADKEENAARVKTILLDLQFQEFTIKSWNTVTPETFDGFKTELKTWIDRKHVISDIASTGLEIAQRNKVHADVLSNELIAYVRSPECTLSEADKEEATAMIKTVFLGSLFQEFVERTLDTVTPETFDSFKTELKTWIDRKYSISEVTSFGLAIAERNNVSAEALFNELIVYVQSPQCAALTAEEKKEWAGKLEGFLRLLVGQDPKLYGKTLDDKEFDWNALRGKYVLIKFTATWCGPCKREIPGMLEAYKMYHDKGLEIVSVYVWEHDPDPVAVVKKVVEEEKLSWIILSEELTARSQQAKQSEFYGINLVPTMVLTDKEGKIIMTRARGKDLQRKLAEIFK